MNISFLKKSLVREFDSVTCEEKTSSVRFFCKFGEKHLEIKLCPEKIRIKFSFEKDTQTCTVIHEEKPKSPNRYAEILCIFSRYLCVETLCAVDSLSNILSMKLPNNFAYEFLSDNLFCLATRKFCITEDLPMLVSNSDMFHVNVVDKKWIFVSQQEGPLAKVEINYQNIVKLLTWFCVSTKKPIEAWLSKNTICFQDSEVPTERMEFPERWNLPKNRLSHPKKFGLIEKYRSILPVRDHLCDLYFRNAEERLIPILEKSESPIQIMVREDLYAQIAARLIDAGYNLMFRRMEDDSIARKIYYLDLSWDSC